MIFSYYRSLIEFSLLHFKAKIQYQAKYPLILYRFMQNTQINNKMLKSNNLNRIY